MARWSSGQDASLSRWKHGFDSRTGHQKRSAHHSVCTSFLLSRTTSKAPPKAEVRRRLPFLLAKRRCLTVEANSELSEAKHIPVRVTPFGVHFFFAVPYHKQSPPKAEGGRIQIRTPPKAISTDIQYRFY